MIITIKDMSLKANIPQRGENVKGKEQMMIVNRVRELRTAAGMTQQALAEQVGVTVPTVSKWELGQRMPELEKVFRLSLIFNVPLDQIIQRTESA